MKSTNRIFYALLTLFAVVGFMGCSEDDDVKTVATEADLVGTWTLKSADFDMSVDGKSIKEYLVDSGMPEEQAEEQAQEVIEQFQLAFEDSEEFEEGTLIEFKSDKQFLVKLPDHEDFEQDGTWELSSDGKKITIDEDGDALTFDIVSISGNNLSLNIDMTDNLGGGMLLDMDIIIMLGLQK